MSNQARILKDISEEGQVSAIDLEENSLPMAKTLGMLWNANEDTFLFNYSFTPDMEFTKRTVLRRQLPFTTLLVS